ncbi:peptidylprolyl isomerase [Prosthecobacter dejongeii]|uniref:Parvulin-like peptidyl-prolyl isomerase n=1 Tax=Prosthecobacter dejongeii TaxID=48465 RepID=A0A7W8DNE2_9BACT|nr:peptidylprolyl isomerase [Prosthecobacter dejongeii]MBB5035826.1 parvulin-like peptidyl-prolyl isomerase [Prosthecobacter dejongeii]
MNSAKKTFSTSVLGLLWMLSAAMPLPAETLGSLGALDVQVEDLQRAVASLEAGQLESVRRDPAMLEQLVRSLLVQRLVLQQAMEQNWHQQPAVVAKLERVRDSTLTETYLESVSQPPPDYPTEAEVRQAYEKTRESLIQPRSFRLAQIFIAQGPDSEKNLAKVEALLKAEKADFADVAGKHSQETLSAAHGGEIGWVTEAQIQPEFREPVTRLKLHEISPPLELKDGWHILKLLDARAAFTPTLEQVRAQLVKQLRQEKLSANTQAYLSRLLKEHPLELNKSALPQVLPAAPANP